MSGDSVLGSDWQGSTPEDARLPAAPGEAAPGAGMVRPCPLVAAGLSRARGEEAAPTAFILTEPTARRKGRP